MVVYRATHLASGAAYIGATTVPLKDRIRKHLADARRGKHTYFCDALRLYGPDAFSWEVLMQCESIEELDAAERLMIAQHKTHYDDGGFNRTRGGMIGRIEHTKRLPETKARMSASQWLKGRTHSDEAKERIAQWSRGRPYEQIFRKLDDGLWPEIRQRREMGESFRKLGESFGVRPETVFYFCKRHAA